MATQPPSPVLQRNAERGRRTHLFVLVFGVLAIVMLLVTDRFRSRVVAEDTLLEAYVAEIKTQITLAHLWVEERVSGDDVPAEEIDTRLGDAIERVVDMLGDGVSDGGSLRARLVDPELRALATSLRDRLAGFRSFASLRRRSYDEGLPVGIGSFADKAFDLDFRATFELAEQLRRALVADRLADERRSRSVFLAILGAWMLIVGIATFALRSREVQRHLAQRALTASQEQLFQAQKMEAVGRLAGGLAHDINNYLAAIRGHCELVRMTNPSGEKLTRRMDGAIQVVDKASSLLTRLLSISHRQPLATEVVDLNDLVGDLGRVFAPTLGAGVKLETELAADLWPVEVDPSQLEQVLANLVVNAKDAMPAGGKVRLTTTNRPAGGRLGIRDEVWLEVADSGQGIAPELLSRIFEPFLTTKPGKAHAGLGLAVVYGIVHQSHGTIEVTSELGHGTTFRIRLPRTAAQGAKVAAKVADKLRPGTAPSGQERLLLVDDSDEFRESTAEWLRALGYQVTTAASAEQALPWVAEEAIELVVSDVMMGGVDGLEFQRRVAEIAPQVPVLLVSGYDREQFVLGESAAAEILPKQQIGQLAWRIRVALDAR